MSIAESLEGFIGIARLARERGKTIRGYVITAFGFLYEGAISAAKVREIMRAYAEMGVREVSLGDTTGMANPHQVIETLGELANESWDISVATHFHNSQGLGLANALADYQAGCRVFDSSIGGIGGCPTSVGAMRNIPTEDLVNMMEGMGVPTRVDFDKLVSVADLAQRTLGADLVSYTHKQGRPNWSRS